MSQLPTLLGALAGLAKSAGEQVLRIYDAEGPLEHDLKSDNSPVTQADLLANEIIVEGLHELEPGVPVLSEEGESISKDAQWMYVVDPLDGTREFLDRNGEFTVNIALIESGLPVLGVIDVPLQRTVYAGAAGQHAWFERAGERAELPMRPLAPRTGPFVVSVSRRHGELSMAACRELLDQHCPGFITQGAGSALKFCILAKGEADLYPRFSPTCAWDVAAGQAILESAGGAVVDRRGNRVRYQASSGWRNGAFYALADAKRDWSFLWP